MTGRLVAPLTTPSQRLPEGSLLWLLACLALTIGPHATRLPWWILCVVTIFAAWRYLIDIRGWKLPGRWVRLLLSLGVLVGLLVNFRTIFGRDAGMAGLVMLITLKLLELRSVRDFMLVVFLCYFLVLGGLLHSQSILTAVYMAGVIIVLTAALIHLTLGGIPLAMLAPALRLSLTILAQALPVMVVLFILFPRLPGPLWNLPYDAHSGLTGMSEDMYPGSLAQLSQSDVVAFRVDFPETGIPPAQQLYWRGLILWDTDGQGWFPGPPLPVRREHANPEGPPILQEITLEPHHKRWLFALDVPVSLPDHATMLEGRLLQSTVDIRERVRYAVLSQPQYGAVDLAAAVRHRALQLPRSVSARMLQLVRRWQAQSSHAAEIVAAALDFFREGGFTYTLTPGMLGDDPIDDFLFRQRRGFCEHYAAAFTTLMRVAGIPARVVTGYQGGEYNPLGHYLIVRQADAHAWSEVWLQGRGWVRVDPTAAIAPERIEHGIDPFRRLSAAGPLLGLEFAEALERALQRGPMGQVARQLRFAWDAVHNRWNLWVLGYNKDRQQRFLQMLGFAEMAWLSVALWMAAIMLTLLLLVSLLLWWRSRQRADPVQHLYRKFCRRLARAGIARRPWEGPLDFAHRTSASFPQRAREIHAITQVYICLRYGLTAENQPLVTQLRQGVRKLRLRTLRPTGEPEGAEPARQFP